MEVLRADRPEVRTCHWSQGQKPQLLCRRCNLAKVAWI
jgi:hypothetical protein